MVIFLVFFSHFNILPPFSSVESGNRSTRYISEIIKLPMQEDVKYVVEKLTVSPYLDELSVDMNLKIENNGDESINESYLIFVWRGSEVYIDDVDIDAPYKIEVSQDKGAFLIIGKYYSEKFPTYSERRGDMILSLTGNGSYISGKATVIKIKYIENSIEPNKSINLRTKINLLESVWRKDYLRGNKILNILFFGLLYSYPFEKYGFELPIMFPSGTVEVIDSAIKFPEDKSSFYFNANVHEEQTMVGGILCWFGPQVFEGYTWINITQHYLNISKCTQYDFYSGAPGDKEIYLYPIKNLEESKFFYEKTPGILLITTQYGFDPSSIGFKFVLPGIIFIIAIFGMFKLKDSGHRLTVGLPLLILLAEIWISEIEKTIFHLNILDIYYLALIITLITGLIISERK